MCWVKAQQPNNRTESKLTPTTHANTIHGKTEPTRLAPPGGAASVVAATTLGDALELETNSFPNSCPPPIGDAGIVVKYFTVTAATSNPTNSAPHAAT